MVLWHILSRERLDQKIAFAQSSNGQLLFTVPERQKDISNGFLGAFLYCLPNLVGGAAFSDSPQLRAIRIELHSSAKIATFRGNPDDIPFEKLRDHWDGLDMLVEASPAWPIRFRQVLLWNPEAIQAWDFKKTDEHFMAEYRKLLSGKILPDEFFMNDFTQEEQIAQAQMLAVRLGINVHSIIPA